MDINKLEIVEIDETPPSLDLTPEEVEILADELVDYHAEFVGLYYRIKATIASILPPPAQHLLHLYKLQPEKVYWRREWFPIRGCPAA
ncbi:MAG: hypothetical protein SVX38_10135 [Chloroflexota bacterium]|nr:hypothetical protein [Chloroflexota bacterium]